MDNQVLFFDKPDTTFTFTWEVHQFIDARTMKLVEKNVPVLIVVALEYAYELDVLKRGYGAPVPILNDHWSLTWLRPLVIKSLDTYAEFGVWKEFTFHVLEPPTGTQHNSRLKFFKHK